MTAAPAPWYSKLPWPMSDRVASGCAGSAQASMASSARDVPSAVSGAIGVAAGLGGVPADRIALDVAIVNQGYSNSGVPLLAAASTTTRSVST